MTKSAQYSRTNCPGLSTEIKLDQLKPGDEILVSLPSSPEDLDKEVWAIVLDRRSGAADEEVWVVINNGTVMHKNPGFAENTVRRFEVSKILKHLRQPGRTNLLRIVTAQEDDTILEIRRVDGKTAPIMVKVDQGDESVVYCVDHVGKERAEQ